MSKTIKKVLSVLLCAVLLFGAAPLNGFVGLRLPSLSSLFAVKAQAADTSGTCGDKLTWSYDIAAATLTISGSGAMSDYVEQYSNNAYVTTAPDEPAAEQASGVKVWQLILDLLNRLFNFVTMIFSIIVIPQ